MPAGGSTALRIVVYQPLPPDSKATGHHFCSCRVQVQRVVNHWLVHVSFSVGCGDTIADEKTVIQITDIIDKCKVRPSHDFIMDGSLRSQGQVKNVMKSAQEGTLKCQPGKTVQETFEKEVNGVLRPTPATGTHPDPAHRGAEQGAGGCGQGRPEQPAAVQPLQDHGGRRVKGEPPEHLPGSRRSNGLQVSMHSPFCKGSLLR